MARRRSAGWAPLVVGVTLGCACTFDTSGVGPGPWVVRSPDALWLVDAPGNTRDDRGGREGAPVGDTTRPDTSGGDTRAPDTRAPDTLPPDTRAPDTLPPDTLPPDTLPPDAGPPPCKTQYGHVQGYKACGETASSCIFYFAAGASCNTACSSGGGSCLHAAAERNNGCDEDYSTPCSQYHSDGLCTCSR